MLTFCFRLLLGSACFCGCSGERGPQSATADSIQAEASFYGPGDTRDSIARIDVDDYPLTTEMLIAGNKDGSAFRIKAGEFESVDKVWLRNDSLDQVLVIELYTDYHRQAIFHFSSHHVPEAIIREMEIHNLEGETASIVQKRASIPAFIDSARRAGAEYFTTLKGFQLGDHKSKAIAAYGAPHTQVMESGVELLEWEYPGENQYDGVADLKGKPLANDSYGHQVVLVFRKEKLIAIVLKNDIP